jgi:tetratricopeptide (TPR) repeat protein
MRSLYLFITLLVLSSCASNEAHISKEENCWSYINKAIEFRKQKNHQSALQQIELHNRCDKSEVRMSYFYHLGWTYYEMGEFKKAINAFSSGLETEPNYLYAYWRRGLAYEMLGDSLSAENDYKKAYEIGMKSKSPEKFLEQLEKNPEIKEKLVK